MQLNEKQKLAEFKRVCGSRGAEAEADDGSSSDSEDADEASSRGSNTDEDEDALAEEGEEEEELLGPKQAHPPYMPNAVDPPAKRSGQDEVTRES